METTIGDQGLNHNDTLARNRRLLLNAIRENAPVSRVELSRLCSLSIATTKRLVDDLISQGLVSEGGALDSRGRGRKASGLGLNPAHGCSIGVDIEPGLMRVTAISFDGAVVYDRALAPETGDRARLQETIFAETQRAVDECVTRGARPLMGVGIGIAGLVSSRDGVILYCPGLPGWENVDLGSLISERFAAPVVIDDGVRCMALAEKRYGANRDLDTFLFIYIGQGVGAGIVLDNRMYRGKNGIAGEFGHITVKENGPLCTCGNRGCLEATVSNSAILASVRALLAADVYSTLRDSDSHDDPLSLEKIRAAAEQGDKLANMVMADTEEFVGIGIADLINIFDPGTVILSGEVVEKLGDSLIEGVQRIVRRRALHAISQRTTIMESGLGANAASLGAATQIIERYLDNGFLNL
ncbi:MAG TPA: ROK family transcriptional regulator [Spirochaetia bacterium]